MVCLTLTKEEEEERRAEGRVDVVLCCKINAIRAPSPHPHSSLVGQRVCQLS